MSNENSVKKIYVSEIDGDSRRRRLVKNKWLDMKRLLKRTVWCSKLREKATQSYLHLKLILWR